MKILLAPTYETAKDIIADATVEAEYGSACVEGRHVTLAHHGPRSGNPAPCNTKNVPVLDDNSTILVSHIDLDTLGGVLALMGNKPEDPEFWAGAEKIDVAGPHHIHELPETVQDKLNAYYAWSETQKRERYTELVDVTDKVAAAAKAVDIICDSRNPEHDGYIRNGRNWVENTTQAVENCLVQETEYARGFVTDGSTFCLGNYYSPNDNRIHPATVQYNGKTKAVSIAFADWSRHGLKANEIVQRLWGPEAGGREGIAGSPRGQEMTMDDFEKAFHTVDSMLKDVREKTIHHIAACAIAEFEKYLTDNRLDLENPEKDQEIDMLDDGTRSFSEIQALIESQPVVFGSQRKELEGSFTRIIGNSIHDALISRDEAIRCAGVMADACADMVKKHGVIASSGKRLEKDELPDRSTCIVDMVNVLSENGICEKEDPAIYYGVIQANNVHDYVHIYTYEQIRGEFDLYKLDKNLLPLPGEEDNKACLDILWPIGGSNSSASFITLLNGEKEAIDFITQAAWGLDYDDPLLVVIAEYGWSLDTNEGCMKDILERYGLNAGDYEQRDERAEEICKEYGLEYNDLYDDDIREIRYSEVEEKLPRVLAEKNLTRIAEEAFELEAWFIGSLSGGIEPPPEVDSVIEDGNGSVSIIYHLPETCGLSDCRYHNTDTDKHIVTYTLSEDGCRLLRNGGEAFPSITGWGDPEYTDKAAEFYKKWHLDAPEEIVREIKDTDDLIQ